MFLLHWLQPPPFFIFQCNYNYPMATEYWFKFNFKDWANDVKPLSLTARGLLMELIIYLRTANGQTKVDIQLLCRLTGGTREEITACMEEYRRHNTFDFTGDMLVSRRITKELKTSETNRANGNMGGNPKLLKKSVNRTRNRSVKPAPDFDTNNNFEGKNKKFIAPTLDQVREFFALNGYSTEISDKAWNYYNDANWHDSKGNAVKNWKQKMRGVWFKEENKTSNGKQQFTSNKQKPVAAKDATDSELIAAVANQHGFTGNMPQDT